MWIAVIGLGVVGLLVLAGSFLAYRLTFYASQKKQDISHSIPSVEQVLPHRNG